MTQAEVDAAGDWLELSLFYHPDAYPFDVNEVERLALEGRRDYNRAACLLGQIQARSRRIDAASAWWIHASTDAMVVEVQCGMGPEQFAVGVAYGEGLAAQGGIGYAAVVVYPQASNMNQATVARTSKYVDSCHDRCDNLAPITGIVVCTAV